MSQSYYSLWYHLVWSTKNRIPLIEKPWKWLLYDHIKEYCAIKEYHLDFINGTENHVHLLIGLSLPDKFSEFIRDIKACSSIWMKQNTSQKYFAWQEGYGSFSVSYSSLEKVYHYIKNQEEHHKTKSFDQEYLELLKKHNLNFDNRFVLG